MTRFMINKFVFVFLTLISTSSFANDQVKEIYKEYTNLITWDFVVSDGNTDKIRLADVKMLPSGVLDTLELLGLFVDFKLARKWEAKSSYGISSEEDIMEIFDATGVVGYAINITECNSEECYGWDALYLDKNGYIVEQTFAQ